jgi:hypothetical protein
MRGCRFASPFVMSAAVALTLVAVAATADAGKAIAQGRSEVARIRHAIAVQEGHNRQLLSTDGVLGSGVTLDSSGSPAVKVYTEHDGVAGIPASVDDLAVVVEVTGEITALSKPTGVGGKPGSFDATARYRPAPIGVSSGNEYLIEVAGTLYCTGGTLGARVKDNAGNVYALSNAHVFAHEGSTAVDDAGHAVSVEDSRILQPGRTDDGCFLGFNPSNNVIGNLTAASPISFNGGTNTVDAAIAETTTSAVDTSTPPNGYGSPAASTLSPPAALGRGAQKYGRTTQLTKGTVSAINVTIQVRYDDGVATFTNQVEVTSQSRGGGFIDGGDSGSLLVTTSGNMPVGLLFAGDAKGRHGFANAIGDVLSAFAVTIDGTP